MRRAAHALLVAAALVALAAAVGPLTGLYRILTVESPSMTPALPVGSWAVELPGERHTVHVGDIVTFEAPDQPGVLRTHRVISIVTPGDEPVVVTKGDANADPDPVPVKLTSGRLWRVAFAVPFLGRLQQALGDPRVLLALANGAALVLVGGATADRIRGRRYRAGTPPSSVPVAAVMGMPSTAPGDRRPRIALRRERRPATAAVGAARSRPRLRLTARSTASAVAGVDAAPAPLRLRVRRPVTALPGPAPVAAIVEEPGPRWRRVGRRLGPAVAAALLVGVAAAEPAGATATTTKSVTQAAISSATLQPPTAVAAVCHSLLGVTGVDVTWTATTSTFATGYTIYRKQGAGAYSQLATVAGRLTVAYHDSSSLVAGTFTYKLQSTYLSWTSVDSSTATVNVVLLC